jgi:N-methylhydantoinase B/oxoprolinase/acetone carboxylase alpha subunit
VWLKPGDRLVVESPGGGGWGGVAVRRRSRSRGISKAKTDMSRRRQPKR